MTTSEQAKMEANAGPRLAILRESFARLTGEVLATDDDALWHLAKPVVAHDTKPAPEFFYANAAALALFRMTAEQFIGLASTRSAEPDHREERAAMLAKLESANIVHDYSGIRIAADGTRFTISDAAIWNLLDEAGDRHGQAALIGQTTPLS